MVECSFKKISGCGFESRCCHYRTVFEYCVFLRYRYKVLKWLLPELVKLIESLIRTWKISNLFLFHFPYNQNVLLCSFLKRFKTSRKKIFQTNILNFGKFCKFTDSKKHSYSLNQGITYLGPSIYNLAFSKNLLEGTVRNIS